MQAVELIMYYPTLKIHIDGFSIDGEWQASTNMDMNTNMKRSIGTNILLCG